MCFGALGAVATAFIATLGPQTGLRTMIITRFSSGYVGCTIYSILNILTQLGFSTTAVILGGQTLASINPGTLPLVVGIIIVGLCSLIPCFIGYHMVHYYERYAWMVSTIFLSFTTIRTGHSTHGEYHLGHLHRDALLMGLGRESRIRHQRRKG